MDLGRDLNWYLDIGSPEMRVRTLWLLAFRSSGRSRSEDGLKEYYRHVQQDDPRTLPLGCLTKALELALHFNDSDRIAEIAGI